MVIARVAPEATAIGRHLAELVGDSAGVSELFVHQQHGTVRLWLIAAPPDLDAEHELYAAAASIRRAFPEQYFEFFLLQCHQYPDGVDLHELIPTDAEQIPLRRMG